MTTTVMTNNNENAGDWRQWQDVWQAQGSGADAMLYTKQTPRTMLEFWQRAYLEDLWSMMGAGRERARYLELGAGRGTTSMYLASKGCEVTLVDLSPAGLQLARRNFDACGFKEPRTVVADARATGLPAESFDCIYNIGLLEHFDDPRPVLQETLRLLKPGGLLFMVIVPEGSPWRSLPVRLTLNPLVTSLRLVQAAVRRLGSRSSGRPSGGPTDHQTAAMVRTGHPGRRYEQWMRELGQNDVRCLPYNPYFQVYRSMFLERRVTIPLYRAHLMFSNRRSSSPRLLTSAQRACCSLLLGRKA